MCLSNGVQFQARAIQQIALNAHENVGLCSFSFKSKTKNFPFPFLDTFRPLDPDSIFQTFL